MDDRSWMYRDSPQGLRRMDYCNGVQGFINFATSIPRNFTGGGIRCPCRKCENKKYLHPDVIMMHHLHKGFMENYQCWYAHREVFVSESERRREEMVVGSTFSASNVHETTNDNIIGMTQQTGESELIRIMVWSKSTQKLDSAT